MATRFTATINKMGQDRVIRIPRAMREMIKDLEGKEILVILEDSVVQ